MRDSQNAHSGSSLEGAGFETSVPRLVPDLATDWSWDEDKTQLTFRLREGVKWHDGKPFTAKDVVCTWDVLTGRSSEKLRINPRKAWYRNLEEVVPNGDSEVTFRLKRPQPSFIALLASGFTPVYPCHVSPRDMRSHPIGTGPFKFVEFKPNEVIRVTRNADYWPADHLLRPRRDVLAASGEGADGDGQQHLQRLAHGGRLARQIGGGANGPEIPRVRSSRRHVDRSRDRRRRPNRSPRAHRLRPRGSSSHLTPRWREMDSNFRSLSQRSRGFGLSSRGIR
jgi:hypothetical protein